MSEIRLPHCSKLFKNREKNNDVIICRYDGIVNFFWRSLFLFSSLVTGPSYTLIPSLVMKLWQFSFIRDWPEICKSEIHPSEFCPISGYWNMLIIPSLARLSLIKCYWILQNSRVTAFTVSESLRENQQGEGLFQDFINGYIKYYDSSQ